MRSSRTITLFSDRPDMTRRSSSFVVSVIMHAGVMSLLFLGLLYPPRLNDKIVTERFDLRHLDLREPDLQKQRSAASDINYPGPHSVAHTLSPGGSPHEEAAVLRQTARAPKGTQTLVQPKVHSDLKLTQETPVPTIVIWKPEETPVKAIVAPPPAPPTSAPVLPSFEAPNHEVTPADIRISATALAAPNVPILPSTTSPVVVRGPNLPQQTPATTTVSTAQPTPTAVLSISDLHMPAGTVFLPPVNETASTNSPGTLTQGQGKESSQPGRGNLASKTGGKGPGQAAGDSKQPTGPAGGAGNQGGAKSGNDQRSQDGNGSGDQPTTDHITLAKNGKFGAVIVGASLEEKYPETAELWSGRLAYTVYLHLGQAKSWILQYSLPRATDAAESGNMTRIEAPWPYNIVRPNLAPGEINADALMVHGYLNQTGHFESLAIIFPPRFTQAKFVLDALQQWQFRPATQNGADIKVEVLLIIPEVTE
jgi:hypothetical protein